MLRRWWSRLLPDRFDLLDPPAGYDLAESPNPVVSVGVLVFFTSVGFWLGEVVSPGELPTETHVPAALASSGAFCLLARASIARHHLSFILGERLVISGLSLSLLGLALATLAWLDLACAGLPFVPSGVESKAGIVEANALFMGQLLLVTFFGSGSILLASRLSRWVRGAWFHRGVVVACAAAGLLLVLSCATRACQRDVKLGAYIDSLPEIGRLPAPPTRSERADNIEIAPWLTGKPTDTRVQATLQDLQVTLGVCQFELSRGVSSASAPPSSSPGRGEIVLHQDTRHGWLFVKVRQVQFSWSTACYRAPERFDPTDPPRYLAFRASDLSPVSLTLGDLRDLTGPPLSWIAVAAAGLLAAVAVLLRAAHLARSTPEIRAGLCDNDGSILLDDGQQVIPVGKRPLAGPVLLVGPGVPGAGTYRSGGSLEGVRVVSGTPEALRGAEKDEQANAAALALAILSLTAGPLLAAAARGLLWPM